MKPFASALLLCCLVTLQGAQSKTMTEEDHPKPKNEVRTGWGQKHHELMEVLNTSKMRPERRLGGSDDTIFDFWEDFFFDGILSDESNCEDYAENVGSYFVRNGLYFRNDEQFSFPFVPVLEDRDGIESYYGFLCDQFGPFVGLEYWIDEDHARCEGDICFFSGYMVTSPEENFIPSYTDFTAVIVKDEDDKKSDKKNNRRRLGGSAYRFDTLHFSDLVVGI